ncbi:MAG: hypothetical protein JXR18_15530 [Neptuniibacter sp.]
MKSFVLGIVVVTVLTGCANKAYIQAAGGYGEQLVGYAETTENLISSINEARNMDERNRVYAQWITSGSVKCKDAGCITHLEYKDAKALADSLQLFGQALVDINKGRADASKEYTADLVEALQNLRDIKTLEKQMVSFDSLNGASRYSQLQKHLSDENLSKLAVLARSIGRWRYDHVASKHIEETLSSTGDLIKSLTEALASVNLALLDQLLSSINESEQTQRRLEKIFLSCQQGCPTFAVISTPTGQTLVYGGSLKEYLDNQISVRDGVSALETTKKKFTIDGKTIDALSQAHSALSKGPESICMSQEKEEGCISVKAAYKQAKEEIDELKALQKGIRTALSKGGNK